MIAKTFLLAYLLLAMGLPAAADAEPTRSALVLVSERSDSLIVEVTSRLCGELSADGFQVERRVSPPTLPARQAVEGAQTTTDASAVLLIAPAAESGATSARLEIWLSDRLLGRTSMARLESTPDTGREAPAQLAVRAVELLRARLSERALSPDEAAREGWQTVPDVQVSPRAPRRAAAAVHAPIRFHFAAGAGLLQSSLGSTWLPVTSLSVGLPLRSQFTLDLSLRGGALSQQTHAARQEGRATISQAFGSGGAALRLRSDRWPEPSVGLATGVYVLQLEGRTTPPYQARRGVVHSSPFVSAGMAVRSPVWAHLCAVLSADIMIVTRPGVVLVAMQEVARAAYVSTLVRAELMAVF